MRVIGQVNLLKHQNKLLQRKKKKKNREVWFWKLLQNQTDDADIAVCCGGLEIYQSCL